MAVTPRLLSHLYVPYKHVPEMSHADPRLPHWELLVRLAMARSVHPGSKNMSTSQGRDVRSYCGSTGYDWSAQASGKVTRANEFGFALEGTHGRSLVLSEPVSCSTGTTAEPSRVWSNSTARSCAQKHLTAWVSPSMQENAYQHADSEAHVSMFL